MYSSFSPQQIQEKMYQLRQYQLQQQYMGQYYQMQQQMYQQQQQQQQEQQRQHSRTSMISNEQSSAPAVNIVTSNLSIPREYVNVLGLDAINAIQKQTGAKIVLRSKHQIVTGTLSIECTGTSFNVQNAHDLIAQIMKHNVQNIDLPKRIQIDDTDEQQGTTRTPQEKE